MSTVRIEIEPCLSHRPDYEAMKAFAAERYGVNVNDACSPGWIDVDADRREVRYLAFDRDEAGRVQTVPGSNDVKRKVVTLKFRSGPPPWPFRPVDDHDRTMARLDRLAR